MLLLAGQQSAGYNLGYYVADKTNYTTHTASRTAGITWEYRLYAGAG